MNQQNFIHLIQKAYFSQLPFNQWHDASWTWDLELIVPAGGGVQWGEFLEYFRWPNHLLTEFNFPNGKIVNFFDGEKAWEGTQLPKALDVERFLISIRLRNLVHDLVTDKAKILKYEEFSGSFKLDYGGEDKPVVMFDTDKGYLLRYEGPSRAMGRPNVAAFEWSDYTLQQGIPTPRIQNLLLNGTVFQRRKLKTFVMNPEEVVVSAAIIVQNNAVLLTRRREKDHLGGMWEFPGGKIHDGESLEQGLRRELAEELGVTAQVNQLYFSTRYEYPGKTVRLHFFLCDILDGVPKPHASEELAWVELKQLSKYPLPPADAELVKKIEGGISHGNR